VQKSLEVDLVLIEHDDTLLSEVELYIVRTAKQHDMNAAHACARYPALEESWLG
jgi:hypothetical protein